MASSGPKLPTVGETDSSVGTVGWVSPENITDDGDVYASGNRASGAQSYYLKGTGYGFSLPSTATIDGIVVTIARKASLNSTRYIDDTIVRLVKGGTVQGDNKAAVGTKWPTTEADALYGGTTDKWGLTWTYSDINASNFGVVLSVKGYSIGAISYVDSIKITVYYTDSGGGSTFKQSRALLGVGW